MITLDNIFENVIAEIIVLIVSSLISIFLPNLIRKGENKTRFDPLSIALLLGLISISNLILNISFWNKQELTILFTLLSMVFGSSVIYVYNNQCPSCKKFIRAKKKIDEKIIKEFNKEIPYQPMKIWKYSNGRIKKKEPRGSKKIRTEKWQTKQEFYECDYCKYRWDSGQVDVPLSIEKESHTIINTGERDPTEPSINGF